jgi:hypothetical protein
MSRVSVRLNLDAIKELKARRSSAQQVLGAFADLYLFMYGDDGQRGAFPIAQLSL